MSGVTSHSLRVQVVGGDGALAETLSGRGSSAGSIVAETIPQSEVTTHGDENGRTERLSVDCWLIDDRNCGDLSGVVEGLATGDATAVVVLLDGGEAQRGLDALRAGATDTFPRQFARESPEQFAQRLATVTPSGRERADYRELFESLSDGLVLHDPDSGEIRDVNERFCTQTGYSREELLGKSVERVIATSEGYSFERARERIQKASEGEPQLFEWRGEKKDDRTYPVEVHLSVVDIRNQQRVLASVRDISTRKRREREYETIFDAVNDTITLHDPDSREMLDANETLVEVTGYDKAEILEQDVDGLSSDGYSGQEAYDILERVARTGEADTVEWAIESRNGERIELESNLTPVVLDDETLVLSLSRDVTEQRAYEQRLRAERDRRSVLFENNPDPVIEVAFEDSRPTIVAANESFESVFGLDADTIGGQTVAKALVPEGEREGYERLLDRTRDGEAVRTEVRRQTDAGVKEFRLRIIPFDSGDQRCAYVWYSDVTERNRRQRRLEEERRRYSTLVEQSSDAVVVVQDEEYVFVNDRFAELTGYDPDTLLEMPFYEIFTGEYQEVVQERYARRVEGETPPRQYDVQIETKAGEKRTLGLAVSRIRHDGAPATLANFRDVTERKRRERALRALQNAAERLQEAESAEAAAATAVDVVGDDLGLTAAACWLGEQESGQLSRVKATEAAEEREWPDTLPASIGDPDGTDRSDEWGEDAVILSLGDHGILAAAGAVADGVTRDAIDTLAEHTTTALDRLDRARAVRESERRLRAILDRIDEAIFFAPVDEITNESPAPDFVSSGYESIWGQSLEDLHETYEDGFFGTLHPEDAAGYRAFVEEIQAAIESEKAEDRYAHEYRIERPDGTVRWVHSDFYPVDWEAVAPRLVVVSRDVTERKARERRMASFDEAADDLAEADTVTEAAERAVEAATETLDLTAVTAYLYDDDGVLRRESSSGVFAEADLPRTIEPGDGPLWETFATGRPTASEDATQAAEWEGASSVGTSIVEEWRVLSLGNHGVLLIGSTSGDFDTDTTQSAHLLTATLEAALNHLQSKQRLAAQQEQLESQTERARRLDRIARLTHQVEAAITAASDSGDVERAVCDRLASTGPYEMAWIGGVEVGADRLSARVVVGTTAQYVDRLQLSTTDDTADRHPAVRAWQTNAVHVADSLVRSGPVDEWRQAALSAGYQALCAVPLTHDDITYGVLTIGADAPGAFGNREREVFEQLGTSVGYALAAIERRRVLESDETVELEFGGEGVEVGFAEAARRAGCRVSHERTVTRQDGDVSVYFSFDGDVPSDAATVATRTLPGETSVVTEDETSLLVETRTDEWFGSPLAEYGAVLREASTENGATVVRVEVSSQTGVRSLVDRVRDLAPGLDLVAKRQHGSDGRTTSELRSQIETELTERQREAVRTALSAGYFEWPRESDGNDVAERLGITQPTLNKHLRLAEQKTFSTLFDPQ